MTEQNEKQERKVELPVIARFSFEDGCAGCCGCDITLSNVGDFVRYEDHKRHLLAMTAERDSEREIVDKIWDIFGRPSYEELKGRSIYDLINGVIAERDAAQKRAKELELWNPAAIEPQAIDDYLCKLRMQLNEGSAFYYDVITWLGHNGINGVDGWSLGEDRKGWQVETWKPIREAADGQIR